MTAPVPEPLRLVVDAGARYRLSVYGAGLACCAVEVVAARTALEQAALLHDPDAPAPEGVEQVEVLVVAGTVTDRLLPALLAAYEAMPSPKAVLSFGACAGTGGPYWDSYVVTKGVDQVLPVDVWVAGCPPRPEALLEGLQALDARRRPPPGVAT